MSINEMLMAAAGSAGGDVNYIDDCFATHLYTGNGSTQTITNDIDLDGEGGLVWIKCRNQARDNCLFDTVRGATKFLQSNNTDSEVTSATSLTAFNSNGFSLGSNATQNTSTDTFCSWTFRKQPKFFDVVTYTGDGTGTSRAISHNLGSVPGMIILKSTSNATNWFVYHRSLSSPNDSYLNLNASNASANAGSNVWDVTSTTFSPGLGNTNGRTYVAYIFAHDAGGFGTAGTDNVISCGTFTGSGGSATVNLGYEPQFILYKGISGAGGTDAWIMLDSMRGIPTGSNSATLFPNFSNAENSGSNRGTLTATGFIANDVSASPYIYMAIRRPMKVPTTGTEVFVTDAAGNNASANGEVFSSTFPVDWHFRKDRTSSNDWFSNSRLIPNSSLKFNTTGAESSLAYVDKYDRMSGIATTNGFDYTNWAGWLFKRAPEFFDQVCYKGTGSTGNAIAHNLTVAPELIIIKGRSGTIGTNNWQVLNSFTSTTYQKAFLNATDANTSFAYTDNGGLAAQPTTTTFTVDNVANYNNASTNYVAYLFATCAGVSKVGSYTGNGTTQAIACGFTGGARFVLIKRTDDTGDWYVYDTARGMTLLTDPYLRLNSTAAESATLGSVTTTTGGFTVDASILAAINTNAASYIFLAIA